MEVSRAMLILYQTLLIFIFEANGQNSCDWGKYGENCNKDCPSTCITNTVKKQIHCQKETGRCSEGCVPGWYEDLCDKACSKNCLRNICNRQNGICTFGCSGNYTGEFCNKRKASVVLEISKEAPSDSNTAQPTNLAAILVPVFLVVIIVFIVIVYFCVDFCRRKRKSRPTPTRYASSDEAASLVEKQPETPQCTSTEDQDTPTTLTLQTDLPYQLKNTSDVFFETDSFKKVKEMLEKFGHVTISGAPGAGKTSMALMLGAEYRTQGYEVVLAEDAGTFQLSNCLCKDKAVCVIFDDIFQDVGPSMDVHRLRQVLYQLHGHLEPWKSKLERRYNNLQRSPGAERRSNDHPDLYFIFTTNTKKLLCAKSKFIDPIFFQNMSIIDLNKLTDKEKKAIWLKHKSHFKCRKDVDVGKSISCKEIIGFPMTCKLYSSHVTFQKLKESFFEMPVYHLKRELDMNISQLDDTSLKRLLTSLCGNEQKPKHRKPKLQTESDNKMEDMHLKVVLDLVSCSHPLIIDMCMSAILDTKPELFLHNCSLKFICEHVRDQQHDTLPGEETVIYFPGAHSDVITARLAEAVADGTFSSYIMYPIWKRDEVANRVYQMLGDEGTMSFDTKHGILHYACFLGNNSFIERLVPHCDINRRAVNGWTAVMFAVTGGQMDSLDLLVKHKADITLCDASDNDLFHLACQHRDIVAVKHVKRLLQKSAAWHINCRGMNDWTPVMCAVFFGKTDVLDYLVQKKKTDLTLKDSNKNTALHLACLYASKAIVNSLLPSIDINCQGKNGMAPVMCALLSGRMDVFDLLLSQNASMNLTDDDNNRLLHLACLSDDIPDILLKEIDCDIQGNHGWTPLMKAAVNGAKHAFDQLDKVKADIYLKDDNNNNLLHLACHGGHVSIVKHVLTMCDVNSRGNKGWTPVMYAAASGSKDVFDLLLSEGADVSLKDDYSNSVFQLACVGGNLSIVECLLPKSDINSRDNHGRTAVMKEADLKMSDEYSDTVLHYACAGGNRTIVEYLLTRIDQNVTGANGWSPIMTAVRCGKLKPFKLLASRDADLTLTGDDGNNLLHLACQGGNKLIVEDLIPKFDINSRGENGRTPLMYAVLNGLSEVFYLLVSKGADMSLKDGDNNSVFDFACLGGNMTIVERLLPDFDINSLDDNARTAIMKAASAGNKSAFNFLLSKNADLFITDVHRDSVLHFACGGGEKTIVQNILHNFDINAQGINGITPIMLAADWGNRNIFNLLVSKQADLTLTDDYRNNLLHHACQGGNRFIVDHLLSLPFDIGINNPGRHGWTPVMVAAQFGMLEPFNLLLEKEVDFTVTDNHCNNMLHLACQGGNITIFQRMLQEFDINGRGQDGRTPLMYAAVGGRKDVFSLLVSKGAKVKNDRSSFGTSAIDLLTSWKADPIQTGGHKDNALHLACQGGNTTIVRYLLKHIDVNIRGQNGLTPIMHAARAGNKNVFNLLLSEKASSKLLDHYTNNLLHFACQGGNRFIIEHLLTEFAINDPGEDGWTPIMMAALSGKMDAYDLILKNGGISSLTTPQNDTVLHAACQGGNKAIVRKVIDSFGINTRGKNGSTPLMRAVVGGRLSVMKFLMSRGADHTLVDKDGLTLLHLACRFGHLDIVKHISDMFNINTKDKAGLTYIMTSILYGKVEIFDYLKRKGADISLVDNTGDDAFSLATKVGCRQIIETLQPNVESERNIVPWNELMRSLVKKETDYLYTWKLIKQHPNFFYWSNFEVF
ncbi:serine/threonine-protein phosphatase 6 regulatory ankyrin repeat subunit B-like [Haliotis asinina]|uniref:serine/threonine-protein phosphatase 6 regulatory ankyrin repeat subunit B-like n=1 Tax=Haliotis asinina TaxID=109174 RepID=UPI0035319DC2